MRKFHKVLLTLAILIIVIISIYIGTDWFSKITGYITSHVIK